MSGGERTTEERERARLEREARRTAREGRPPPAARPPEPPPPFERTQPPAADPPAAGPVRRFGRPTSTPGRTPTVRGAAERATAARELVQRRREALAGRSPNAGARRVIALVAGGLLALVVAWFLLSLFQPFKGDGDGTVRVTIPKGAGVGQIADLLAKREVISSAFFFKARATLSGRREDFKAGTFKLKRGMSHAAAMDAIAKGPAPDVVTLTIPEGRSRREVKGIVGGRLPGDYLAVTKRSSQLDPRRYGARRARDLEGFLFPATYELKRGRPVGELVNQQLQAFRRQFASVDLGFARRKNLNRYDILVIASMVEREAQVAKERRIVASVIYNRLHEGIPLGIDATIRFATNNWTRPLTRSQLAIDSPYNTRTRQGLPPGPIGSPGLAAIRAAARPAKTRFLFYVVKPGRCGEHDFSKTDAEFQRDVERYNRERRRRGGKSPTNC